MTATRLHLAADLTLPLDAVTETFAILAKRGVGKTHTASVMAEEMLSVGAQIVVIDPTDVWWGLRSSADGKSEGQPIYVIGGNHADVPLEATAGPLLADLVVGSGVSLILAVRHLSKTQQRRLVADFCERLYHRKGEKDHQTPLHVFVDEADAFVPQSPKGDVARCYGAIDDIVRRGRASGLGVTLITQRSAVIAKDVLTQAEVLVALRTISPQDRKALDAWVEAHDAHDQRGPFMASIASLAVGEAWVWSPGWLDLFKRVKIRPRLTFDSSATPKAGERRVEPKHLATVDLEKLGAEIIATKERAEANDPKRLRAQVAELTKKLAAAEQSHSEPTRETVEVRVEVPIVPPEWPDLRRAIGGLNVTQLEALVVAYREVQSYSERLAAFFDAAPRSEIRPAVTNITARAAHDASPWPAGPRSKPRAPKIEADPNVKLAEGARRMLAAIAQFPAGLTKSQCATRARIKKTGGTFAKYQSTLKTAGLIDVDGEWFTATEAGRALAGVESMDALSGAALIADWRGRLGGDKSGCRRMFDLLIDAYPQSIARDELGERAEIEMTGGTFSKYLSTLRTNDLAVVDGDRIFASPSLFMDD